MDKHQLRKIQLLQLKIATEIKRICEKHKITYFLIAGSLLGSVRHKGFIPWDDDMDIGMPRDDYEHFIKICDTTLQEGYFLQTWNSDENYAFPFAKLQLIGTKYVESYSSAVNKHNGIYVDIFPFDNAPDNLLFRLLQGFTTYYLQRLLLAKCNYRPWKDNEYTKKAIYTVLRLMLYQIPSSYIKSLLHNRMTTHNNSKTQKVVAIGGSYGYFKESFPKQWIASQTQLDFEGHRFPAPSSYTEYLEHLYGDFMTPPPEDDRGNRHSIIEVDLADH